MHSPRSVLISGASVAGPALAYWLCRYGFDVTIVERAASVRSGGYPIDVRGTALDVIEQMGVLRPLQAEHIHMRRFSFLDPRGELICAIPPEEITGGDASALEMPRGALTGALYGLTQQQPIRYRFADSIEALEDDGEGVNVLFTSGEKSRYDLVIGADGLHSHTRALVMGPEAPFNRYLGFCFNLFSMPNLQGLSHEAVVYSELGRSASLIGVRDEPTQYVMLCFASAQPPFGANANALEQRRRTADRFAGAGWEVPRLVEGLMKADDLFFDTVSQIRLPRWSVGRVGLVGDAACAPSFLSGQGSSMALVGAYVLAGELAATNDVEQALANYERIARPYMDANQGLVGDGGNIMTPRTQDELDARNHMLRSRAKQEHTAMPGDHSRQVHRAIALPNYRHLLKN